MWTYGVPDVAWVLFAHFTVEFANANDWLVINKGRLPILMIAHCVMYACITSCALFLLGVWAPWKFWVLLLSHAPVDYAKHYASGRYWDRWRPWINIHIDQAIHIGILLWLFFVR
jgi:uncharacterized membrane protein YphA (DoxX/SURF4 family)